MDEIGCALQWVVDRLVSDAQMQSLVGGRVYRAVAPDGADYPLVVLNVIGYAHQEASGGRGRPIRLVDVLVRCWNRGGDYGSVTSIGARIDALLHSPDATTVDSFVVEGGKRLSSAITLDEEIDGERYVSAGGLYRIYIAQEVS